MIIVKVSGKGSRVAADVVAKALRNAGIDTTYWTDVKSSDRQPHADARSKKATVLVLELNGK